MVNIYEELGIPTYINAYAAFTVLGGVCMSEETIEYMASAAREFADIKVFQSVVHRKIAEMTHNEAAYITPGAMAGIYLATCAAVTQKYGKNIRYLTKEEIGKCEVLAFKSQRNPYDRAIEQTGVKTVDFMYPNMWDIPTKTHLENSINENTTAIYVLAGGRNVFPTYMSLEEIIEVAERHKFQCWWMLLLRFRRLIHSGNTIRRGLLSLLSPVEKIWGDRRPVV